MAELNRVECGDQPPKGVYLLLYGSISRNGDNVTITVNTGMQNISGWNNAYRYNRHAVYLWIDGAQKLNNYEVKPQSYNNLGRGYYGAGDHSFTFNCPDVHTFDIYVELWDTGWSRNIAQLHGYLTSSQNKSKISYSSNKGSNWSKDRFIYKTTNYGANWEKCNLHKSTNSGSSWSKIL